jgi:hypothetical protein
MNQVLILRLRLGRSRPAKSQSGVGEAAADRNREMAQGKRDPISEVTSKRLYGLDSQKAEHTFTPSVQGQ